jgi:flagellin-like protein
MSAISRSLTPTPDGRSPRDRGVSAVIGIVLLVAVTVLLVTVVGGFVLAFTGPGESPPQSDFFFDHTELESGGTFVAVTHLGGESIPAGELDIVVRGVEGGTETWAWETQDVDVTAADTLVLGGDAAGGAVTIEGGSAVVQIRWSAPDSDRTYVLAQEEVTA